MKPLALAALPALLLLSACGGGCPDDFARACAKKGCVDKVKAALAKDPSLLTKPDGRGLFPLHTAADGPIAEALIAAGADIEQIAGTQQGPLGSAMHDGRGEVVRVLLAKGVKVHDMSQLLHRAVGDGHASVVEAIVDSGVPATDGELLYAVINDKVAAAEVLLKKGARADAKMDAGMKMFSLSDTREGMRSETKDVSDKKALELAQSSAMRELLKKHGAN